MSQLVAAVAIAAVLAASGCQDSPSSPPGGASPTSAADDRPPPAAQGPIDPKAAEALAFLAKVPHPPPAAEAKQFCKSLRALNRAAETCVPCVDALVKALPHVTEEMNQGVCWLKDLGRVEPPRADLCRALAAIMVRDQRDMADYAFRALARQGAGCRAQAKDTLAWVIPRMRRFEDDLSDLIAADLDELENIVPLLSAGELAELRAAAGELVARADRVLATKPPGPGREVVERLRASAQALAGGQSK